MARPLVQCSELGDGRGGGHPWRPVHKIAAGIGSHVVWDMFCFHAAGLIRLFSIRNAIFGKHFTTCSFHSFGSLLRALRSQNSM